MARKVIEDDVLLVLGRAAGKNTKQVCAAMKLLWPNRRVASYLEDLKNHGFAQVTKDHSDPRWVQARFGRPVYKFWLTDAGLQRQLKIVNRQTSAQQTVRC